VHLPADLTSSSTRSSPAGARPDQNGLPAVAMVSFRFGGADGVSVAASHWAAALRRLGFRVYTVAGQGPVDRVVRGLSLEQAVRPSEAALREALEPADLVVVENLCSLPLRPEATRVVVETIRARPAILHHHDLPWQRERYAHVEGWPPDDPAWVHVTINQRSRMELAARGIGALTVYNGFREKPSGRRGETRRRIRVSPGEMLLLQPTRAIARKRIEVGVSVAEAVGATYWLTGPAEEGFGEQAERILGAAGCPVRRGLPSGVTVADAYAAADAVVLPSSWEGFGCPLIESALHRRPLAVSDFPVAEEIVRFGFRWFSVDDPASLRRWLTRPTQGLIEHNLALARRHFGLQALTVRLAEVLRHGERKGWSFGPGWPRR
jgi:glycosyltransferase involved in cell wall biosynthesis